jgi:two-component system chemotaxis response regulator CheY
MVDDTRKPLILFVDDDDRLREASLVLLRRAGYDVDEARDGVEALRALRARPADVMVCDIFMPEKDGLETIQALRREFTGVKVIAVSGGGFQGAMDVLRIARLMGAAEVLSKPFKPEALTAAIERLLAMK